MNFKSRVIFLSSMGFALGIMLGTVITAVTTTMEYADGNVYLCSKEFNAFIGNPLLAFVVQALVSGIYGMIGMGGSSVYYIEKWSILRATVSHFIVTVGCYYLTAFFLRWISPSAVSDCFIMFLLFLIPYLMIWLNKYLSYKSQINEINKELIVLKASEYADNDAA
ncbi:MAG: DUF3021 domain-containing protein [Lachnospiraceae bacterium]|nr:DUF3021 domain-containing protein [Lachnospiraceae bacterium]